jgi:anti-sigma B factor antagonist
LPLTLDTRGVGDVSIIRCGGRIVAGSETDSLREHINMILQDRRDIVLHLGDVVFIDSSGLGMLVRLLTTTRRVGGDLKLCQVRDDVLKVLKITNLTKLFDVHESEQSAIASVYKRQTVSEQVGSKGSTVMCVDQSVDVLACLRQVLRSTGYNILSNSNLHDSLILIRATRPSLLILGPNLGGSAATQRAFREACATVPVVELGDQFSTQDAGEAASDLLAKIGSCLQTHGLSS